MGRKVNELLAFMGKATRDMADDYERIRRRASEDPGTAGDQGEENWAGLLRNWLPSTFHVVTKGRLLRHDGSATPQVDVIVLYPEYPTGLLNSNEKLYLASGVAAAFECKLTLTAAHLKDALEDAVEVKRSAPPRTGSPFRELHSPIVYGLLAHSHSWKEPGSKPIENIERHLWEQDERVVTHPREMIDLTCIADLGTWVTAKVAFMGPQYMKDWSKAAPIFGERGSARTHYVRSSEHSPGQGSDFTPIGAMVTALLRKVAWESPGLRRIAEYFTSANVGGAAATEGVRLWDLGIYSEAVRTRILAGRLTGNIYWDEWAMGYF